MQDMKKAVSADQFQKAIKGLDIGAQTIEIAFGVLVEGKSQAAFAEKFALTRGAVSQAVSRVWEAHLAKSLPKGFKVVTAVLPEHQAFIVQRWSEEAKRKLETEL